MPNIIRLSNMAFSGTGELYFTKDNLNGMPEEVFNRLSNPGLLHQAVMRGQGIARLVSEDNPILNERSFHMQKLETIAGNRVIITGTLWTDNGKAFDNQTRSIAYFITNVGDIIFPTETEWEIPRY